MSRLRRKDVSCFALIICLCLLGLVASAALTTGTATRPSLLSLFKPFSFFSDGHVAVLQAKWALLYTLFFLLLRQTRGVILMVALVDHDSLCELLLANY